MGKTEPENAQKPKVADQRRDALLKRMLETPPKPHKPTTKKGGSPKTAAPARKRK